MSHHAEWTTEERPPGWFGRLVMPESGGRPATMAFAVAILGAAAFVASLALDWLVLSVKITETDEPSPFPGDGSTILRTAAIDPASTGIVYALGGVALLTLVGAVITRPDLALRLRMAATGLGVGLLAIVGAIVLQGPRQVEQQFLGSFGAPQASISVAYEAGLFCAIAAIALTTVSIWLTARPLARGQKRAAEAAAPTSIEAVAADSAPARLDGARGIYVSASEPLDLSVTPEAWPR